MKTSKPKVADEKSGYHVKPGHVRLTAVVPEALARKARVRAASEGKRIGETIQDALVAYLKEARS